MRIALFAKNRVYRNPASKSFCAEKYPISSEVFKSFTKIKVRAQTAISTCVLEPGHLALSAKIQSQMGFQLGLIFFCTPSGWSRANL